MISRFHFNMSFVWWFSDCFELYLQKKNIQNFKIIFFRLSSICTLKMILNSLIFAHSTNSLNEWTDLVHWKARSYYIWWGKWERSSFLFFYFSSVMWNNWTLYERLFVVLKIDFNDLRSRKEWKKIVLNKNK